MIKNNFYIRAISSLTLFVLIVLCGLKIIYGQTSTTNNTGETILNYIPPPSTIITTSPTSSTTTTTSSSSSSNTTKDIIQPRPQIIHPLNNSINLSGNILVGIYINPTVVLEMRIFGVNPAGKTIELPGNPATRTGGTNYSLWWDTKAVPDGLYRIFAVATLSNQIKTYSDKITVTIKNNRDTSPINETTTLVGQVQDPEGNYTQRTSDEQTQVSALTPNTNVPITSAPAVPNPIATQTLISNSRLLTNLDFNLDHDKPLYLANIETRQTIENQNMIVLTGQSYPDSFVTISIMSNPLVLSTKTDASGTWTYVLEDPLAPGEHEVFIEVTSDSGNVEKSGPYPFSIARAQATAANPDGNSLQIIDPQKEATKFYLYLGGGSILFALIVISLFFLFRRKNLLKVQTQPLK